MSDTTDIQTQPKITLEDLLTRCTDYDDMSLSMDARELKMLKQHIDLLKAETCTADAAVSELKMQRGYLALESNDLFDLLQDMTLQRDEMIADYVRVTDELIKLKGDQLPVFLKQTGIGFNSCQGSYKEYVTIGEGEYEENPAKHLKLFTAPQKPVVLPEKYEPRIGGNYGIELVGVPNGEVCLVSDVIAAIEAAGGKAEE